MVFSGIGTARDGERARGTSRRSRLRKKGFGFWRGTGKFSSLQGADIATPFVGRAIEFNLKKGDRRVASRLVSEAKLGSLLEKK